MRRSAFRGAVFRSLVLLLLAPAAAAAQSRTPIERPLPQYGVGYVFGPPDLMAGGDAFVVLPTLGGLGVYVDAKFDTSSPSKESNYDGSLTSQDVLAERTGNEYSDDADSWMTLDVALLRPVTPALMVYAGVGYAKRSWYHLYYDPQKQYGLAGYYWVRAPSYDSTSLNGIAGIFLRISSLLTTQFGIETAPRGGVLGISLTLPRR